MRLQVASARVSWQMVHTSMSESLRIRGRIVSRITYVCSARPELPREQSMRQTQQRILIAARRRCVLTGSSYPHVMGISLAPERDHLPERRSGYHRIRSQGHDVEPAPNPPISSGTTSRVPVLPRKASRLSKSVQILSSIPIQTNQQSTSYTPWQAATTPSQPLSAGCVGVGREPSSADNSQR